ncbi:MAG: hypothetical protein ACREAB_09315 [Blastocatellia bacterium]
MKLKVFDDKVALGEAAARQAAAALRRAVVERGTARIIAATGASQFEFLAALTATPDLDWRQVGEGWFASLAEVPERAITMSVRQILKSREIICIVPDARKAQAVKACFEGEISRLAPASIPRTHPDVTVYPDRESASLLDPQLLTGPDQ